jgi:hypothetical protein
MSRYAVTDDGGGFTVRDTVEHRFIAHYPQRAIAETLADSLEQLENSLANVPKRLDRRTEIV